MSFEVGTTVGGYEFIGVVASSKAGVAYKVRNVLIERVELLRVLPKEFQDDQERVSRFLREMRVHARLLHPNIVTFYNATELDGQLVMTTELVEGASLAERLEQGALAWREAVQYVDQVLSALSCAHEHGVVHRDIRPENMIITPAGTVKLTGFELAKAATDPQLTQVGTAVGPVKYMSPEQVKGTSAPDGRSDLYSLGAVFYEAVTGCPPFDSQSQFEVMLGHVNSVPMDPSRRNRELPRELDRIILTALAKEPAQRFQTAEEFRQALKQAQAAGETVQPPRRTDAPHLEEERAPMHVSRDAEAYAWRQDAGAPSAGAMLLASPAAKPEPTTTELVWAGLLTFTITTVLLVAILIAIKW